MPSAGCQAGGGHERALEDLDKLVPQAHIAGREVPEPKAVATKQLPHPKVPVVRRLGVRAVLRCRVGRLLPRVPFMASILVRDGKTQELNFTNQPDER